MTTKNVGRTISFAKPSVEEVVRARADECQSLVNSYLAAPNQSSIPTLTQALQLSGASTDEVEEYISQAEHHSNTKFSQYSHDHPSMTETQNIVLTRCRWC